MGARPLGRVIQEHIKKPLADEVLFGKLKKGGTVRVTVETNEDGKTGLKLESIADELRVKPKKEDPSEEEAKVAPKKAEEAGRCESRSRRPRDRTAPSAAWCRNCPARADEARKQKIKKPRFAGAFFLAPSFPFLDSPKFGSRRSTGEDWMIDVLVIAIGDDPVDDLLQMLHRADMRLGDEAVVAGDPVAFDDFRQVAQDVGDAPQARRAGA